MVESSYLTPKGEDLILTVWVKPGAKRLELSSVSPERIVVSLSDRPIENRANDQLISFLSDLLRLPRNRILIRGGKSSRLKTITLISAATIETSIRLRIEGPTRAS